MPDACDRFNDTPTAGPPDPDDAPGLGPVPMLVDYRGSITEWHGPAWAVTGGMPCAGCQDHAAEPVDGACLAVRGPDYRWRMLHMARAESWTVRAEHPTDPAESAPTPTGYRRLTDHLCTRRAPVAGPITRYNVYRIADNGGPIHTRWFIDRDRYGASEPCDRYKVFLSGGDTTSGFLGLVGGACARQTGFGRTLAECGAHLDEQFSGKKPGAWDE
jgi:hypothetical protein